MEAKMTEKELETLNYYKRKLKEYQQAIAEFNIENPKMAYVLNGYIIKHTLEKNDENN